MIKARKKKTVLHSIPVLDGAERAIDCDGDVDEASGDNGDEGGTIPDKNK